MEARVEYRRRPTIAHAALLGFLACIGLRYWSWRLCDTFNPGAPLLFAVALLVEAALTLSALSWYFMTSRSTRHAERPAVRRCSVDVFVPTVDEELSLLRETLLAVADISYPHTTYILDDGRRPPVKALAEEMGVVYVDRPDRQFAKAGNLNNGLEHSGGELILVLDADHVPLPEILDRLVCFFDDEHVALVQTAQEFYNHDSFQHDDPRTGQTSQDQQAFFRVIQPGRDVYNAAIYCGSPALIRRRALQSIGGFATGTVTEDVHTGLRLQRSGWRVIYHTAVVAYGLAPETFRGYSIQWDRWGRGFMQMLRAEGLGGLSLGQRYCYADSLLFYLTRYAQAALPALPAFTLLSGALPFVAPASEFASFFLPYFAGHLALASYLHGGLRAFLHQERMSFLRMPILMGAIRGLFARDLPFRVTPKGRAAGVSLGELWFQTALIVGLSAAIVVGSFRVGNLAGHPMVWAYIASIAWCALNLELLLFGVLRALGRKERRGLYRFSLDPAVPVRLSGPSGIQGRARGLNRAGMEVEHDLLLDASRGLEVEIALDGCRLTLPATLAWSKAQEDGKTRLSGIRFSGADLRDLDVVSRYLHRRSAAAEQ